jgi:tetratricopeptide (TPR) repeat protein
MRTANAEDGINLDQAQEFIQKAMEMDPENGAYIDSLGWVYFKKGMIEEALTEIERASNILEDAEVLEHLGDIYQVKGELEKAKDAYQRALVLDAERESVKEKLRKCLIRKNK